MSPGEDLQMLTLNHQSQHLPDSWLAHSSGTSLTRAAGEPNLKLFPLEILDLCRPSGLQAVVLSVVTMNRVNV